MSVVAVGMVRDEVDVIAGVVRHWATQVDHVVVADNLSTDGTRDVLHQLARELPLTVVDDPDPAYRQADKMTALAALAAAQLGAKWVVPCDADELWYALDGRRVADVLADTDQPVLWVPIYNHLRTVLDLPDQDPFRSMVWRQAEPQPTLGKVAFRWEPGARIHQGNHGVDLPAADPYGLFADPQQVIPDSGLALRHFPVRSAQHLITKARNGAAAYAAAPDLPPEAGAHWRAWGEILDTYGEGALRAAYREHWLYMSPVDAGLVRDPAPYHGGVT